jgi:hypothetical protein
LFYFYGSFGTHEFYVNHFIFIKKTEEIEKTTLHREPYITQLTLKKKAMVKRTLFYFQGSLEHMNFTWISSIRKDRK